MKCHYTDCGLEAEDNRSICIYHKAVERLDRDLKGYVRVEPKSEISSQLEAIKKNKIGIREAT